MKKFFKKWKLICMMAIAIVSIFGVVKLSAAGNIVVVISGDSIDESIAWEVGTNPVTWSATAYQDGTEQDLSDPNTRITWKSTDPTVILAKNNTVSGAVSSISLQAVGAGCATISAKYERVGGDGTVEVLAEMEKTITVSLRVLNAPSTVFEDSDADFTINTNSNHELVWTSSNSGVASVRKGAAGKGILSFNGAGLAVITCSEADGSVSARFEVVVNARFTEEVTRLIVPYAQNYSLRTNSGGNIYFESANPNIVTVTGDGTARGRNAGATTLYVAAVSRDNLWYGKVTRRSIPVFVKLEIVSDSSNVVVGDTLNLDTNIAEGYKGGVNWTSDDTSIAEVNSQGIVTAKKKGTVTIRASVYNEELFGEAVTQVAQIVVTVADKFTLNEVTHTANEGTTFTLKALASDSTANITWSSSNEEVVTVAPDRDDPFTAVVTAVSKGTARITAVQIVNGIERKAECIVTVKRPVLGVSIQPTLDLNIGESWPLIPSFTPDNPDNKNVKWSSSNENIVTVSDTGVVNAVGGGQAAITVITEDGMYVSSCIVTVTVPVTSVELSAHNVDIEFAVGQYQLTAKVSPDDKGVITDVVWISDDSSIAVVSGDGLVTFRKPGTVSIRVQTKGLNSNGMNCFDTCLFKIRQPVTGLALDTNEKNVQVGDTFTLYPTISPSDATNKNVIWKIPASARNIIEKIDENGNFRAIGSGKCTLVAEAEDDGSVEASCVITVTQPVTDIDSIEDKIIMRKGTTRDLNKNIVILPEDASDKTVRWKSSNGNVVVDSATGEASAVKPGQAIITVISVGSSKVLTQFTIEVVQDVTGVVLNYTTKSVNQNDTFLLRATVQPSNAYNKKVTWYSSDASVATVNSDGVVKGIKGGYAYIYAKTIEGGYIARCRVNVIEKIKKITIADSGHTLNYGKSKYLKVTIERESASNKKLKWTVSNKKVLKINSTTGKIKAVGYGTSYVYARAKDGSGKYARYKIRVIRPVKKITISPKKLTIYEGKSKILKAVVSPSNASIRKIKWTSSDSEVAKVDSAGRITAISPGTCIISATSTDGNQIQGTCYVIVKKVIPATNIRINSSKLTMLTGQRRTLAARVAPSNATESYKWYTTDESVVTVSKDGVVRARGQGTAEVYAISNVSGVESTRCTVTVLALNSTRIVLEQYDTFDLDVFGSSGTINWYSSNKRVAVVNRSGMITAKMAGHAFITAKANGKTLRCSITVVRMKK